MNLYFDENLWASIPQNAAKSGVNDWNYKFAPDPSGTSGLSALGITPATEWTWQEVIDFVAATADATVTNTLGILTDFQVVSSGTSILTERILIEVEKICNHNGIYIKWLNANGGWEYGYFNLRQIQGANVSDLGDGQKSVLNIFTSNEKDITTDGKSNDVFTLFHNGLKQRVYFLNRWVDNFSKWADFSKMAVKNDAWIFKKRMVTNMTVSDYSVTVPGTSLITCTENHELQSGDIVYLKDTKYTATTEYEIFLLSDTTFYINLAYSATGDQTGYCKKKIEARDWERVKIRNVDLVKDNTQELFNIKFDVITSKVG